MNQANLSARWSGRIKSYQPGTGYGFIECSETYQRFGRDVYLSEYELRKLDIKTLPAGSEVTFEVEMHGTYPRARNLVLPHRHVNVEGEGFGLKRCEYILYDYACALDKLLDCLSRNGLDDDSYHALRQAEDVLRCEQCRRDEQTAEAKVLLLLSQARQRWEDSKHTSHQTLHNGLCKRLSPPLTQAQELSIDRIRFTQQTRSKRFLHGPHAGKRIEWLTEQLLAGTISLRNPSMVLNVVYFHGAYRSLNNRHLTAVVQYARIMESWNQLPEKCYVRVWPLVRSLALGFCMAIGLWRSFRMQTRPVICLCDKFR